MQDEQGAEHAWTADELAQFRALDTEREASPELKRRTVEALRARALLGAPITVRAAVSPRLVAALAAAASVVFAAGTLVGYAAGTRRVSPSAPGANAAAHTVAEADSTTLPPRAAKQVIWY